MSEVVRLRTRAEVDQEAATWTWRLDGAALSPEERRAYESWLRQDPRHRRAMEELSKVWGALDQLGAARFSDQHIVGAEREFVPPQRRPRHHWSWFVAAAVLGAVVIAAVWLF